MKQGLDKEANDEDKDFQGRRWPSVAGIGKTDVRFEVRSSSYAPARGTHMHLHSSCLQNGYMIGKERLIQTVRDKDTAVVYIDI